MSTMTATGSAHDSLVEQCRAALARQGVTAYAAATRAGLPPRNVRRFLQGDAGLRSANLAALLSVLDLRVVPGREVAR